MFTKVLDLLFQYRKRYDPFRDCWVNKISIIYYSFNTASGMTLFAIRKMVITWTMMNRGSFNTASGMTLFAILAGDGINGIKKVFQYRKRYDPNRDTVAWKP